MRRAALSLLALLALALLATGCVEGPAGSPTGTPSETLQSPTDSATDVQTPLPNRTVELPTGPKERPERPETPTEDSVGEFAKTFEYRLVYNKLWYSDDTEVYLDCELQDVTERAGWYEATVSCTGSSNTRGEAEGTGAVTELHSDWFTQTFVYSIDENSLIRERAGDQN